ncbi:hypothetical protein ACLOJK_023572 [Asimina triloba]
MDCREQWRLVVGGWLDLATVAPWPSDEMLAIDRVIWAVDLSCCPCSSRRVGSCRRHPLVRLEPLVETIRLELAVRATEVVHPAFAAMVATVARPPCTPPRSAMDLRSIDAATTKDLRRCR